MPTRKKESSVATSGASASRRVGNDDLGSRLARRCIDGLPENQKNEMLELATPSEDWVSAAFEADVLPSLRQFEQERIESLALCRIPHALRGRPPARTRS